MTVIRQARPEDHERIAVLAGEEAGPFASGPNRQAFVAERGGALAGFLTLRIRRFGRKPDRAGVRARLLAWLRPRPVPPDSIVQPFAIGLLESVFVTPDLRRQGIGRALVREALEWLEARTVAEAQAQVRSGDEAALGFLNAIGFEPARYLFRLRSEGAS